MASHGDEIAHVTKARGSRRKMRDKVVKIADDVKMLPPQGDLVRNAPMQHARTAKAKTKEVRTKFGTVIPDPFMAKNGKCGAVTVAHRTDLAHGRIKDR